MLTNLKYLFTTQEKLQFSFGKANLIFAALILFISFLDTLEWSVCMQDFNSATMLSVVPVVTYSNADTMKESVVKENKGKSGVYRWTNKISNKIYIGSSSNLGSRFRNYYKYSFLTSNRSQNMIIYKALLKYGYSNFILDILEYCELQDVISREQHYLDLLNPEYNVLKIAGSNLGYKHTEENLAILKNHLLKLNEGKGFKVEIVDQFSNTTNTFNSVREAAKSINMSKGTLLNNEKKKLDKGIDILIKKRYLVKIFRNTETDI